MAGQRWEIARLVVHGAPLLGVVTWLAALQLPGQGWNFPLLFAPGLFMLASGLVIPLAVRLLVATGAWRIAADQELWFQARVGLVVLGLAVVGFCFVAMGTPRPGGRPPESFDVVLGLGAGLCAFVLPLLEAGHAIFALWSAPR